MGPSITAQVSDRLERVVVDHAAGDQSRAFMYLRALLGPLCSLDESARAFASKAARRSTAAAPGRDAR